MVQSLCYKPAAGACQSRMLFCHPIYYTYVTIHQSDNYTDSDIDALAARNAASNTASNTAARTDHPASCAIIHAPRPVGARGAGAAGGR